MQALGDVVCDLIDEEAQESAYAFVSLVKLADDFQADVQRLLQEVLLRHTGVQSFDAFAELEFVLCRPEVMDAAWVQLS